MTLFRSFFFLTLTAVSAALVSANEIEALFPMPAEVRTIINNRCVMCHGEVIDGEAEIREDLLMVTDDDIRETLIDVRTLYEVILEDEMPQEARLSARLRRNPEMRDRLNKLREDYEAQGEKAVLIKWLEAALKKAE